MLMPAQPAGVVCRITRWSARNSGCWQVEAPPPVLAALCYLPATFSSLPLLNATGKIFVPKLAVAAAAGLLLVLTLSIVRLEARQANPFWFFSIYVDGKGVSRFAVSKTGASWLYDGFAQGLAA